MVSIVTWHCKNSSEEKCNMFDIVFWELFCYLICRLISEPFLSILNTCKVILVGIAVWKIAIIIKFDFFWGYYFEQLSWLSGWDHGLSTLKVLFNKFFTLKIWAAWPDIPSVSLIRCKHEALDLKCTIVCFKEVKIDKWLDLCYTFLPIYCCVRIDG